MKQWVISQALATAQTLGLDRLDAQLLLLHALGKLDSERAWLMAHDDDALPEQALEVFRSLTLRRIAGEPLAYIVGYKEFFGLRFNVDARVLVPRPDTETLVQWALDVVQDTNDAEVLDLGTGSGAVGIAVAHSLKCQVTATDVSAQALSVAKKNAEKLGVEIRFIQSNWFEKVKHRYHVIASNPPYIMSEDSHLETLTYEPIDALASGADGMYDIRQIVRRASKHLRPCGWLLLEHGYNQALEVRELLTRYGFEQVQSRMDFAGIARCSGGRWDNQTTEYLKGHSHG